MADTYDRDDQDQSEVFDETHTDEDAAEFRTFEETPDVLDVTQVLGDTRDIRALDADEFNEDDLDDEDLDTDEDLDDAPRDELEDEDEDNDYGDDPDDRDGVDLAPSGDAEVEFTGDVDDVTDPKDDDAEDYESSRVSDEDLRMLGYPDEKTDETEPTGTGAKPEDVAEEADPRQEELLDEGVEETFPASDPVSVKRIT
jgi:hypothetical protein